ncbi:MAG: hypothetical protein JRL30_03900 [Deltaproteobacteria bacterium]|nr:hypothetical protein [Deltaproteobacteria bacterium]
MTRAKKRPFNPFYLIDRLSQKVLGFPDTGMEPHADQWREVILVRSQWAGLVLSLFAYVPGMVLLVYEKRWGLLSLANLFYICGVSFCLMRRLRYDIRAIGTALILYLLGLGIVISRGPFTGGPVWLYVSSLAAALYLGRRASYWFLALNGVTLIVLGICIYLGYFSWGPILNKPLMNWAIAVILFMALNAIGAISVAVLVEGLETTLRNERAVTVKLSHEIKERKRIEEELKRHKDHLEELVEARTAELKRTNDLLSEEISERKHTERTLTEAYKELKMTQAQLVQSSKLASIGELASGIAHELNQPLMVIRANTQLALRGFQGERLSEERLIEYLEPVERNTKRMMDIIDHLRTFSRQSEKEFLLIDINQVIGESFTMVGEQLRVHDIEVKKDLTDELPAIKGDFNQLEQVFLNLITNSRDAIEQGRAMGKKGHPGLIEIVSRLSESQKSYVEVLVRDNGPGIPRQYMGKIFDPFFTTKDVGKGTGLGLSISYGIIKDHHGEIDVSETGPQGTAFRIRIPAVK